MKLITKTILILFSFFLLSKAQTSDSVKIYLWPEGAPYAQGTEEVDKPSITIYFPEKQKKSEGAVLVCPGGGYVTLALGHEGWQVARWFNQQGMTAAILRYRLGTWDHKKYKHPAMITDAKRAMRLFRSKAKEYGINPEKIGVIGFSAGGHLASCLSTMFDGGNANAKDPIEKVSCRPNFSILLYPVISFRTKYAFEFGRGVLLGDNADAKLVDSMSTETRVTPYTPPTFLVHAADDWVKVENSLMYYTALRENNVPSEIHIYERGGHGFGFYPQKEKDRQNPERIADWPERLKNWLRNRGGLIVD
ncbi:MAG: alpha/beta hydrolase [Bacteroidota bacterium]|nr:alpha/beta hydrolase [Bacteroidota bacterium]